MAEQLIQAPAARTSKSRAESKAENTDKLARAIIDAEVTARDAKSERLRQARLARDEQEEANAPAPKPRQRKKATATGAKKAPAAAKKPRATAKKA